MTGTCLLNEGLFNSINLYIINSPFYQSDYTVVSVRGYVCIYLFIIVIVGHVIYSDYIVLLPQFANQAQFGNLKGKPDIVRRLASKSFYFSCFT